MKWRLLVVTDHTTHAETNSVYHLSRALREDPRCEKIWICSQGLIQNRDFFNGHPKAKIYASAVTGDFEYNSTGSYFHKDVIKLDTKEIDAILIRMPQPLNPAFLFSLESIVPQHNIINDPSGIVETSNKAFLLEVAHLCPEPVLCNNLHQALELSRVKEIVLKPLYSYGGRGIMRLSKDYCWIANDRYPLREVSGILTDHHFPMLALNYLKKVTLGDKRTIVVNQKILGSALRLPAPGSWMCNVAQGGHAVIAEADEDELSIERHLTPMLYRKGIVIYGFDTLVNDEGRRVLSEINTLSIGGLLPLQDMTGKPIVREAAELLLDYLEVK